MTNINSVTLSVRIFITSENNDFSSCAFKELQEISSILKYCNFYVKLFCVMINLVIYNVEEIQVPEQLKVDIQSILRLSNRENIIDLVKKISQYIIREETSEKTELGFLVLLFKVCCLTSEKNLISIIILSQNTACFKCFCPCSTRVNKYDVKIRRLVFFTPASWF